MKYQHVSEFNPCPGQRGDSACHFPDNTGQRLPYPGQCGDIACHILGNAGTAPAISRATWEQRLPYPGQRGNSACYIPDNAGTAPAIFQTTRGQHLLYPGQRGDSTCSTRQRSAPSHSTQSRTAFPHNALFFLLLFFLLF